MFQVFLALTDGVKLLISKQMFFFEQVINFMWNSWTSYTISELAIPKLISNKLLEQIWWLKFKSITSNSDKRKEYNYLLNDHRENIK